MKPYKLMLVGCVGMLLTIFVGGCKLSNAYDYSPYYHIQVEEEMRLTDDDSSPYCDFSIYFSCLDEEDDSIARIVNRNIQREFLGSDYGTLPPEAAVDSFKNTYYRDYRQEIGSLYQMEKANVSSDEEIPAWFNQTYSMVTTVDEGKADVITATANIFVDMGGAHPNQWSRWINFHAKTGKPLTKEDVFLSSAQPELEQLLLEKLILHQSELYPEETIASLEDLHQRGFLQLTDIYIPDNFLLGKNGVLFLYNRYDIAPYSAGEIVLELPYEKIGQYLKN